MTRLALFLIALCLNRLSGESIEVWRNRELWKVLGVKSAEELEVKNVAQPTFPFGKATAVFKVREKRAGAPVFEFVTYKSGGLWDGAGGMIAQGVRNQVSGKSPRPTNIEYLVDRIVDQGGRETLVAVVSAAPRWFVLGAYGFRREYDFIVVRIPAGTETIEAHKSEPPEMGLMRKLAKAFDDHLSRELPSGASTPAPAASMAAASEKQVPSREDSAKIMQAFVEREPRITVFSHAFHGAKAEIYFEDRKNRKVRFDTSVEFGTTYDVMLFFSLQLDDSLSNVLEYKCLAFGAYYTPPNATNVSQTSPFIKFPFEEFDEFCKDPKAYVVKKVGTP